MKIANVVSVQNRGTLDATSDKPQCGSRIDRMSTFLRRYPQIEDGERLQLLSFLTTGPQEEIVQVTHLQGLETRFHAFREDHPQEFPSGLKAWLPMILFVVIAAVGVAWRLLS